MALVGWMRVSTRLQSLDGQIERLTQAGCEKIFGGIQSGVSKKNEEELDRMIDWIREGDIVVCIKIDRLGRSLKQVIDTIERIRLKGAAIRALDQAIDTSRTDDPMSRMMINLLAMFGEMERDLIRERSLAGKARTGNVGGRPKKVSDKDRTEILRAYREGTSIAALSRAYGVHRRTIQRLVQPVKALEAQ